MQAKQILCVVDLIYVAPIVCGGSMFGPCFVIQYYLCGLYSFAIVMMRRRELVSLPLLASCCHMTVIVLWLYTWYRVLVCSVYCGISLIIPSYLFVTKGKYSSYIVIEGTKIMYDKAWMPTSWLYPLHSSRQLEMINSIHGHRMHVTNSFDSTWHTISHGTIYG